MFVGLGSVLLQLYLFNVDPDGLSIFWRDPVVVIQLDVSISGERF